MGFDFYQNSSEKLDSFYLLLFLIPILQANLGSLTASQHLFSEYISLCELLSFVESSPGNPAASPFLCSDHYHSGMVQRHSQYLQTIGKQLKMQSQQLEFKNPFQTQRYYNLYKIIRFHTTTELFWQFSPQKSVPITILQNTEASAQRDASLWAQVNLQQ